MTTTVRGPAARATSRLLIGRHDALARLDRALADALGASRVGTVLVEGPAGIGKSRIVEEFRGRVVTRDGEVLVGRCVPLGEEIFPYAPIAELLRDLVARTGADSVRTRAGPAWPELARLVPALAPDDAAPEATTASVSRLFQACCSLFDALSAEHPLVLVIEDLHWADRSTRELLALLANQLRGNALLVLTQRTDEAPLDPGVARLTAELGRRTHDRVALEPLTRDEQAHQISDILGVPPTRALLEQVYTRAEGNPFFAEELLALRGTAELPPTVRDLLLARLDALAPATRQLLRVCAVIGRTIPHALLEAVADLGRERLEEALRSAVREHVLVTTPDSTGYQFRHALLQESVADGLLPGEAARMHRRVAEALEVDPALAGDTGFVAGLEARHWYAAGDRAKALVASVAAAREAKTALAFSESLSHFERALALLDHIPDGDSLLPVPRYQLYRRAAEVAHLAARPARAAELVRAAIAGVDPGDEISHAYLHERLGRYLWMAADGQGSLAAYRRAVDLLPADEEPSRWRAAVLSGYSQILMLAGRYDESEPFARRAIEVARVAPGGRSIEGHARNNLGVDLARRGEIDAGIAELLEARRIAEEEMDDVDDVARAIVNLASVLEDGGRVAESAEVSLQGIEVVERLGLEHRKGVWCRSDAADSLVLLGRYSEADRILADARALEPSGIDLLRTHLVTGHLRLRQGDFPAAADAFSLVYDEGHDLLDAQFVGPLHQGLVELATWTGDFEAARRWASEGADRLRPAEDPVYAVPVFTAAIAAQVEESLASRAPAPLSSPDPWLARIEASKLGPGSVAPHPAAHEASARCELARATGDDRGREWAAVAAAWDVLEDPWRATYARLRGAEALLRTRERDPAADLLGEARRTALRIGAAHLVALADDVGRRGRLRIADAADAPDNPFHLTPREREVLALVADGLADREIGARLFISHRTVERHVSNLLAKLDASRRTELTALAHRLDLVPPRDD